MKMINVQAAKTHLSRLMETAATGTDILLSKHGKAMVRLTAYLPTSIPRRLGGLNKKIRIAKDFDAEDKRIQNLFLGSSV